MCMNYLSNSKYIGGYKWTLKYVLNIYINNLLKSLFNFGFRMLSGLSRRHRKIVVAGTSVGKAMKVSDAESIALFGWKLVLGSILRVPIIFQDWNRKSPLTRNAVIKISTVIDFSHAKFNTDAIRFLATNSPTLIFRFEGSLLIASKILSVS